MRFVFEHSKEENKRGGTPCPHVNNFQAFEDCCLKSSKEKGKELKKTS